MMEFLLDKSRLRGHCEACDSPVLIGAFLLFFADFPKTSLDKNFESEYAITAKDHAFEA